VRGKSLLPSIFSLPYNEFAPSVNVGCPFNPLDFPAFLSSLLLSSPVWTDRLRCYVPPPFFPFGKRPAGVPREPTLSSLNCEGHRHVRKTCGLCSSFLKRFRSSDHFLPLHPFPPSRFPLAPFPQKGPPPSLKDQTRAISVPFN